MILREVRLYKVVETLTLNFFFISVMAGDPSDNVLKITPVVSYITYTIHLHIISLHGNLQHCSVADYIYW